MQHELRVLVEHTWIRIAMGDVSESDAAGGSKFGGCHAMLAKDRMAEGQLILPVRVPLGKAMCLTEKVSRLQGSTTYLMPECVVLLWCLGLRYTGAWPNKARGVACDAGGLAGMNLFYCIVTLGRSRRALPVARGPLAV